MKDSISSAGLIYIYLNGFERDNFLHIRPTDTYRYIEAAFYRQVMKKIAEADTDPAATHIFAVLGPKDKTSAILNLLENTLKENYQRILTDTPIRKSSRELDTTGNSFFRCIQEFFCEQLGHFPQRIYHEYEDFTLAGIYCSPLPENMGLSVAENLVSLWLEREVPCLCGKQIMIRSFLLRNLIGRKVVACIPQRQPGPWNLVFEGGHPLPLETDLPYTAETIHPNELGGFCSSNLQTILMNPIYAYGIWFRPNGLCEEWHKVFLYLCAVSRYSWDANRLAKVYKKFLNFLQDHICETTHAEPIISEEKYLAVLLLHIQKFRTFLKGKDEPVISKDLHQTMNSRYVYLPYLWSLVPHQKKSVDFSPSVLHTMVKESVNIRNPYKRGSHWEDTAAYVLNQISGWTITARRIRAGSQEIDISIANVSLDDDLWKLGAYILVECKNWRTRVDLPQIRNIAHISAMKGTKTALLFSANGVTKDAEAEIIRLLSENLSVICLTAEDLLRIQKRSDCRQLILKKWRSLQDALHITDLI